MRRILQLSVLCLAAGVLNACTPEEVIITEDIPTAGIRFIHAVPDAGAFDFRPVDIVENSTFYAVTFRSTTLLFYKNARAGSRHFRIFRNGSTPDIASIVVVDTVVTLEPDHRYTFILWGRFDGSAPPMKLTILDDNPADPGAQVALRLINAAAGLGPLDGRWYTVSGTPPAGTPPVDPSWPAVPELSASAYVSAPTGSIRYNVQPAGGGTNLFNDATALAGAPPDLVLGLDALPGTTQAGSAVSGIVFPRSVVGSPAPQTAAFQVPSILFLWDRRPPRLPGL